MMIRELQSIIEPAVKALGYDLWGCEWVGAGKNRRLLRVYVDREEGVNIDACAKISRQISAVLDVEDPIASAYLLEVSSPGIERPLFTLDQCRHYIGQRIEIRLRSPNAGRRNFKGLIQSVTDDCIALQMDPQTLVEFAWRDIEKACLRPETI
jgi:ribosome maturation factor RimP